jgi:2-keto-4-pentenoate hydratase
MTQAAIGQAADMLAAARKGGTRFDRFPDHCRPGDLATAYAVQDALHERLGTTIGYKIGCTTPVMQRYLCVDHPCAGGIFAGTVHKSPASLRYRDFRHIGVECEIAVRLGRDLPGSAAPYDRAGVADAVAECMAAIELVDDRYLDYHQLDAASMIADDFFGAGCVLGPVRRDWQTLDLAACEAFMTVNGKSAGRGSGALVLGHPFEALAWLANSLAERGKALRAGDIVMTGSMVETRWLEAGDWVDVTVEGLGVAALSVS